MNKFSLLCLIFLLGITFSCNDDDATKPVPKEPADEVDIPPVLEEKDKVNDFIWKAMNHWYFWQEDVPNLADNRFSDEEKYTKFINSNKDHEDFFYKLLHQYGQEDRFSWVVDDVEALMAKFAGKQAATGMNFGLGLLSDKNTVIGLVNYVVPGSAADVAGLKRGDVFIKINGKKLTVQNYASSLSGDKFTITVGENYDVNNNTWTEEKTYTINGGELQENPIHFSKVIEEGNKKIAYLVMNAFRANYNDELNAVFADFKAQGATDLILDLRYNGGGSVNTALALGQMITGQHTGKKYVSLEYNSKNTASNNFRFLSKDVNIFDFKDGESKHVRDEPANSLGLNKVYVLTSKSTASASELTIIALKPYINVVQIGEETYGKFVGSITLVDDPSSNYTNYQNRNKNHKYGMQPIVFAYYNATKQRFSFNKGLTPDKEIKFFDYIGEIKEFGNPSDPALAEALQEITGKSYRKPSRKSSKQQVDFIESTITMDRFGTELYDTDISALK